MSLWLLILLLGVIKLPLAALMLWLPLRHDEAMRTQQLPDPSDDDGGSRALPASPLDAGETGQGPTELPVFPSATNETAPVAVLDQFFTLLGDPLATTSPAS